jgi:undecaprenyl pyrophosphate synthase
MSKNGVKKYTLVIPQKLFDEVQELAQEEHTTVVDIIKQSLKLRLVTARLAKSSEADLLIREGGVERILVI